MPAKKAPSDAAAPDTNLPTAPEPGKLPEIRVVESSDLLLDTAKFEHLWRVSQMFAKSDLVPEQFRGKPENCFVACQIATRMDVDPFMFMQNSYVVHGRPGIEAKLAIALINQRGPFTGPVQWIVGGDGDEYGATAYATHRSTGERCEFRVDVAMAKREGWYEKNTKWKNLTELMCRYRSAMFLGRLYCPEVLMGMQSGDELEDVAPPRRVENTAPKVGRHEVGRIGSAADPASVEGFPSHVTIVNTDTLPDAIEAKRAEVAAKGHVAIRVAQIIDVVLASGAIEADAVGDPFKVAEAMAGDWLISMKYKPEQLADDGVWKLVRGKAPKVDWSKRVPATA